MKTSELRTINELCADVRKSRTWIHAIKREMEIAGINWPGNMMSARIVTLFAQRRNFKSTRYSHKKRLTS